MYYKRQRETLKGPLLDETGKTRDNGGVGTLNDSRVLTTLAWVRHRVTAFYRPECFSAADVVILIAPPSSFDENFGF